MPYYSHHFCIICNSSTRKASLSGQVPFERPDQILIYDCSRTNAIMIHISISRAVIYLSIVVISFFFFQFAVLSFVNVILNWRGKLRRACLLATVSSMNNSNFSDWLRIQKWWDDVDVSAHWFLTDVPRAFCKCSAKLWKPNFFLYSGGIL